MLSGNLIKRLRSLDSSGLTRRLGVSDSQFIDFTSNDYLGIAKNGNLLNDLPQSLQSGAGASRLLSGFHEEHSKLEEYAANFFKSEKTLFFSSGYSAGLALTSTLPARGDAIIYDSLIHACMRDGIRLSSAKAYKAHHNDMESFKDCIVRARKNGARDIWIIAEAVYSMDGDKAPLSELLQIAEKYSAWLILDEAHSSGILGENGKGLSEDARYEGLITLHTCGKSYGAAGGLVCASGNVIDVLVNTARSFIYTTAPIPIQAFLVRKSLALSEKQSWRRKKLLDLQAIFKKLLPVNVNSQIVPIILGDEQSAINAAKILKEKGFAVACVRPPTVPRGAARLRLSLNAALFDKNLIDLAALLEVECHL